MTDEREPGPVPGSMDRLPPAPGRGPIFIMGAMGAGTTLLRLLLDSHGSIAITPETGFARTAVPHEFVPFRWPGRRWYKRLGWTQEEFEERLSGFYDELFMRYAREHGKHRWGEKTPSHVWHIDRLARLFPDAAFIGIVRHPAASVASNISRWGFGRARAIGHYRRFNREIVRQAARHGDRFVLLRYEELVLHTEQVMRELLAWLGEPWSDDVLRHHEVQSARSGPKVVEGYTRVDDPVDPSRLSKWKDSMPPRSVAKIAETLGDLGAFLGYSVEDPVALQAVAGGERRLMGGREVRARFAEFPALDLASPGEVPIVDRLLDPREVQLKPAHPPQDGFERRAITVLRRMSPRMQRRVLRRARPIMRRLNWKPSPAQKRAMRKAALARRQKRRR